ncbi:phycobilisome protein [Nostocaceae cyanobacterium CENA357]|uniref:Phycobilisome protein n=1 Tax=Atlanticothrix silvestris CENA357 TaxID=1725252 RepID=A0A8J7L372_9CYAN|nr:phycobilisome protein [Atlanticothrix silvestris]MBH8553526.1 phycobilisome protein [Atlanticothrix silvestris CENA357]
MIKPQLSEKVQELIQKARIVSFATWHNTHPAAAIQLFQIADDQRRYLTDDDCQQLQKLVPDTAELILVTQILRDRVNDIVDEARTEVLKTFPNITQSGGGLYPPERAEACCRDFWHFLRCITYGIAGGHTDYTSAESLHYMQLLYQELRVPLDAMVVGLEGIKVASLQCLEPQQQEIFAPYFDHLIGQLQQFQN